MVSGHFSLCKMRKCRTNVTGKPAAEFDVAMAKGEEAGSALARTSGSLAFGEPVTSYLLYNGSASSSV